MKPLESVVYTSANQKNNRSRELIEIVAGELVMELTKIQTLVVVARTIVASCSQALCLVQAVMQIKANGIARPKPPFMISATQPFPLSQNSIEPFLKVG